MTGFLMTLGSMCGAVIAMPNWKHSRKWSLMPFFVMCLVTIVIGFFWATGRI